MDNPKTAPKATVTDIWPEPQPLPRGLPAVEPFDYDLLPDVFRPWVKDIAERMQCPPDFPAVAAMATLAGVVGKQVGIRPKRRDDWLVVPNLWGAVIGRPGKLKTPAITEPMKPLYRLEIDAKEEYDAAMKSFEADKWVAAEREKVRSDDIRKAIRAGTDANSIAQRALDEAMPEPTRRRYIINDPTVEKLGELLNKNPCGLLLFRDELTGWLRMLDKDGHENDRAFYLESWNGNHRYTYDRVGRGTIDIENACVSILGGIQPQMLIDYMRTAPDDGLMQRFQLIVWPDDTSEWKNVDRYPDTDAKNVAYAVYQRLVDLGATEAGAQQDGGIPFFRFDDEAQELFTEWRCELEARLRSPDLHPTLETHLSKYRSLIPSLALLIHLADGNVGPVKLYALERAILWGDYLESHARRVYAPNATPELLAARALARRIKAGELGKTFSARDVYLKGWTYLGSPDAVHKAALLLVDFDWLEARTEQTGGRTRTVYVVNPRVERVEL